MGNDIIFQVKDIAKTNILLENIYFLELPKTSYVANLQRNLISLGELNDEYKLRFIKDIQKYI